MRYKSQKICFLLGTLLMCSQLSARAPSLKERVAALEQQFAEKNQVRPEIGYANDFFVDGSYLYWSPYEEGLSYVKVMEAPTSAYSTCVKENLEFKWDSGFRAGVGYRMPYDTWEIATHWTRIYNGFVESPTIVATNTSTLSSAWLTPTDLSQVNACWQAHLNVIDGEIARFFQATSHLALKPHVGVRGLWLNQFYGVKGVNSAGVNVHNLHSRCRAVGLRAGVDTEWEFAKGWSFYGNIGGSILSNGIRVNSTLITPGTGGTTKAAGITKLTSIIMPTLDCTVGFGWDYSFSKKAALSLRAGWEFNDFFGQNKLTSFALSSNSDSYSTDLTYQGVTVSGRLDF